MRLGIFGGSFNPVHYGHLLLAECCRETCALDEVWLIPAAVPPHKQSQSLAPAKARLEMLELALAGNERLRACSLEVERGGVSYTVDTLATIAAERSGIELFLLMGADSLYDLVNWRQPSRICELATPIVVRRSGAPLPDLEVLSAFVSSARLDEIRRTQVEMPIVELSSTDLRQRAASGHSLRYRTPRAVEQYIQTHGLYQEPLTRDH
ncbi:MAG: nicotinate-nucleotide adenylyltransferase [Pirellulaceae bacterium]